MRLEFFDCIEPRADSNQRLKTSDQNLMPIPSNIKHAVNILGDII